MARKRTTEQSGRSVLVIDDNHEYLSATARVIARDGHEVLTASSGADGLAILKARYVDLVLVDYFMPHMTGEEFVTELRTFNPHVQVVLQTGYAGERPARETLRRLDIQGFHDKSDGPDKLGLWVDVGLKAAFAVQLLQKSRLGLSYILNATPELHKIQPLEDLLQGMLLQAAGLLGAVDSFLAVADPARAAEQGFVAVVQQGGALRVRAGTGRFLHVERIEDRLSPERLAGVAEALQSGRIHAADGATVLPLRVAGATLGVIYIDRTVSIERDAELLAVFANQAAVAVQNASLYELAAVDQLTRVYARRFFEHALLRGLRVAHRTGEPLGVLLVDVDDMKTLNDVGGHLAGDRALALVGAALKSVVRASDIVGRYGGDEFAVVLPHTDVAGVDAVLRRLQAACAGMHVETPDGRRLPVTLTIGAATLEPRPVQARPQPQPHAWFESVAKALLGRADEGLYIAKRAGKARSHRSEALTWPESNGAGAVEVSGELDVSPFGMPLLDVAS